MDVHKLNAFKSNLRSYQCSILEMCIDYLFLEDNDYALVHLPTGTGKTGIMASLCAISKTKNILIIVPNAVLPEQTLNEIKKDFWRKIDINLKKLDIQDINIKLLNNKDLLKELGDSNGKVYISTMQFLQRNISEDSSINTEIVDNSNKNIDYIFFDEGHREPAAEWSKIIRSFKSKLILFTATPYRNDNSTFKISEKYIYILRKWNILLMRDIFLM